MADGKLLDGEQGKIKLVKKVLTFIGSTIQFGIPHGDIVVIDAQFLLHQMGSLPSWEQNGKYLAMAFCKKIEETADHAPTVIICFDQYNEISFKENTRTIRKGGNPIKDLNVQRNTSIKNVSLQELFIGQHNHQTVIEKVVRCRIFC